ncbi:MAG: uroporphyrinogen decarboxylase family protein [Planctomycetota bacterium]
MNGFERYTAMLAGKRPDFVPRVPILMQFAAEYIGSNYGVFASDWKVLVEANEKCAEAFGLDQVSAISDPFRETAGFGGEIVFVKDGVPRLVKPPLLDTKDLGALAAPDPMTSPRMRDRVDAVRAFKEKVGGRYSILGWIEGPAAEAADLRGVTQFLMDLMDDEPFAGALMDRSIEVGVEFARAQVEAGADTVGVGDAIASQLSPELYERLVLPREKRLVDAIHGMGARVRLHICGNITHLLRGIARLGADIVDVDHMVKMPTARRALGDRVALAGNLDPATAVQRGTPKAIRERVRDLYAEVGNPFLVAAGCEVSPLTPPANLRALCEPMGYVP